VTTATFFYHDIDDLIFAIDVNPDPIISEFVNSNIDHSESYGVEASIDLEIVKNLRLTGNYTYMHTEVKGTPTAFGIADGSRLLRRPTHKASFDLIWGFLDNRAELAANILYVGDRKDLTRKSPPADTLGDYVTLNLTGRIKVNESLTIFARVDNVLDEDYEDIFGFGTAGASAYGGIRLEY
jgi:vitamin B12 transporter